MRSNYARKTVTLLEQHPAKQSKYMVTAYRVLRTLQYLLAYREGVSNSALLDYLSEDTNTPIGIETLAKYLNTLRKAGCEIPLANGDGVYRLLASPVGVRLKDNQPLLINEALNKTFLHTQCQVSWLQGWQLLLWHLDLDPASYAGELTPDAMEALEGLAEIRRLLAVGKPDASQSLNGGMPPSISTWQQYCDDGMALAIDYYPPTTQQPVQLCLDPVAVKEESGVVDLVFTGVCRHTGHQHKLNTAWIVSVKTLPVKSQRRTQIVRVVFKLWGKLAKTYRLYPDEVVIGNVSGAECRDIDQQSLTVVAKTANPEELLQRLMKYGGLCEVVSPAYIRQQVARKVQLMVEANLSSPKNR